MASELRILIEVVHPAHVHFFRVPIERLIARGHRVLIASRDKDVTLSLLDDAGADHRCISSAGHGLFQLAIELLHRDVALWRLARRFRPDVMCGYGGVAISHVGKVLGIRTLAFYDTEKAVLQQRLTLPFIDKQYVPTCYDGLTAAGRTARFQGPKELSNLHPDNFAADRNIAVRAGLAENRPNFMLRVVNWGANHDHGASGWRLETLRKIVAKFAPRGKVHISVEGELPPDLENFAYQGSAEAFHHLLAHCDLYLGESATIACEALVLGVPSIYGVADRRSYIDELAQLGLIYSVGSNSEQALFELIDEALRSDRSGWESARETWIKTVGNLGEFVTDKILEHGHSSR
ncbi:MAG: DUF354 domain-containing protein [Pseudomonadota bacterium]